MESENRFTAWVREQIVAGKAESGRQIAKYTGLSPDTVAKILRGAR